MQLKSIIFVIVLFILTGCNSSNKIIEEISVSFNKVLSFKDALECRDSWSDKIRNDKSLSSALINKLDSIYWERVMILLKDNINVLKNLNDPASLKLSKIIDVKNDFIINQYSGLKSLQSATKISNILILIENYILSLKHLQTWDNRRYKLEEEVRNFGLNKFSAHLVETKIETEEIEICDSVTNRTEGEYKQIDYKINYLKIYQGFSGKYKAEGTSWWTIKLKDNQVTLTIINHCPQCYSEKPIN
jgi:hypothetical protein